MTIVGQRFDMVYSTLISATELRSILSSTKTLVFDVRFSLTDVAYGQRAYASGHIPGAIYLHLDHDLSGAKSPTTGRHPLPDIEVFGERIRSLGVSSDVQVIVYDDAAGMFAARCWWLLRWLGHHAVAVLDGGLPAWIQSGGEQSEEVPGDRLPGTFRPVANPDMLVQVDQLQAGLAAGRISLCDARAPERFRGDVEPIDKVAGHVPGAFNRPFASNLNSDGQFKSADELAAIHFPPGQDASDRRLVHMCGSGVTACHNVLAAAIAGKPLPALYAGSWSEWITDPTRPVAAGKDLS